MESAPAEAFERAVALPVVPLAEDVRQELILDAAVRSGHPDVAVEMLHELEQAISDEGELFERRTQRADLLLSLGRLDEAEELISALVRQRGDIEGATAERRYEHARVLRLEHDLAVRLGRDARAREVATILLVDLPAELATRAPGLVVSPADLSERQRWRRARNQFDAWDYAGAREGFEAFRDDPARREEAIWHLALIGLRRLRDRPVEAEGYLRELSQPGRPHAEEALFLLSRARMVQEQYDDARAIQQEYRQRYPRGEEVALVDYFDGWLHYDHRENQKAIEGFDRFIARYGRRSEHSTYVYGFRAWAFMRLGRWREAIDAWQDLVPFGNPLVEGKAYYWQAYAWRQLGDLERAVERLDLLRRRWPITYYGMLGEQLRAEIDGRDARASQVWWPAGGGQADDTPRIDLFAASIPRLSESERRHWQRVLTLSRLHEYSRARDGFTGLRGKILRGVPASQKNAWIHALGVLVGDYKPMYVAAWDSIAGYPGMIDGRALRSVMAYPRAWRGVVEEVGAEFGVSPWFVWSIMRQESRYNPGQISGTNAMGALQMQPETARRIASELGIDFNLATFHRPEVGFRYSGFYMRKLSDTFSGLIVPTASAYNTGPGPIARWFHKNPDATFPWLIEEFEYNEGRAYGRKVAEHMLRYLYLYEPDAVKRGALLDRMFPLDRAITIPDQVGY